jgi:hypothetical protein
VSIGFPDGQRITQWLGAVVVTATGLVIGNVLHEDGPFNLASWASVIVAIKPTGGNVTVTVKQQISGGPPSLIEPVTVVVPAGQTVFESVVLFGDVVTLQLLGSAPGVSVDYALYPSNVTTNAQVLASATVNFQKDEVLVAAEPTLDLLTANQNLWTLTDDAPNTRMKLALLAGLPSVLANRSAADVWGNNGGGTGGEQPMALDLEAWDTDGFHDLAVNTSRLTVPAGLAGKYLAIGWTSWQLSAAGFRQVGFKKNGVAQQGVNIQPGVAVGGEQDMQVLQFLSLAVGDYVELGVFQNSGGNLNTNSGSYLGMVRFGP